MIKIPFSPDKAKNARHSWKGDSVPCAICGRAIRDINKASHIRTYYGSDAVTAAEYADLQASNPGGETGAYPVGADCLRAHPELLPYVIEDQARAKAALARPDADTALSLLFWRVTALDRANDACLSHTYGRGKGGLGTWILIVRPPSDDLKGLVSGLDWLYRSFIRAWSEADAIELANLRLQKWLDKQAKAASRPV